MGDVTSTDEWLKSQTVNFRRASISDLPAIVSIYNEAIETGGFTADLDPYTVAERQAWYEKANVDSYGIWVLEYSAEVIGYFYFSPWRSGRRALRHTAELSFYLQEKSRGKGFGFLIVEQAIVQASHQEFKKLLAILLAKNIASKNLLSKCGFEDIGFLPAVAEIDGKQASQLIMLKSV